MPLTEKDKLREREIEESKKQAEKERLKIQWRIWNDEHSKDPQFIKDIQNYKNEREVMVVYKRKYKNELEKLKQDNFIQSYEPLASTSTSSSSPWSDKKQEQEKKQTSSSRDEKQKEMKYNNDPFQSPFSQ